MTFPTVMARLFTFFTALMAIFTSVQANTEIQNFGPILCRADEYGHLAAKAASQLSKDWPQLNVSSSPSIYSVLPQPIQRVNLSHSRHGNWLVLDLTNDGLFTLPSPHLVASWKQDNPRDKLIRKLFNKIDWFLNKRFTLRASYAANVPMSISLELHTPESALQIGGIEWQAEQVEASTPESELVSPTSGFPTGAYSVVPKQTANPSRKEAINESENDMVPNPVSADKQLSQDEQYILAAETIPLPTKQDDNLPYYPCEQVYLHLITKREGVRIPPLRRSHSARLPLVVNLFDGLATTANSFYSDKEEKNLKVPIHLTLEPLSIGLVPRVVFTGVFLHIVVAGLFGWLILVPFFEKMLILNETKESFKTE